MLPRDLRPRNAARRPRTGTPGGGRNLRPRDRVVLPDEDEARGGDFYDCEWGAAHPPRSAPSCFPDEDDDADDLTEAVAWARAKREQTLRVDAHADAGRAAPATHDNGPAGDAPAPADAPAPGAGTVPPAETTAEAVPLTAEEIRHQIRRNRRIMKRTREADRKRIGGITNAAALAGETADTVMCYGAGLRLTVEMQADAHAELYNVPLDEPPEARRTRLADALAVVIRGRKKLAAYDGWVASHRPELADDGLLDGLAGSKEDRAAAKARLAELDRKYRAGTATGAAANLDPHALPLMYREEFQGKVRAYPEWVTRVLRKLTGNRGVPAVALVLAQLAYWMRPTDDTGRPRASRAKFIVGKWWIVLGYGQIEKQTPLSLGQARRAVKQLRELGLIETLAATDAGVGSEAGGVNFGPNTVFLRVRTEVLDPLVKELMPGVPRSASEQRVGRRAASGDPASK